MECPFVGLVPYSRENADYFFGREEETKVVINHLLGARLTIIYGASGVGKSSVLKAGVESTLRERLLPQIRRGRPKFLVVQFSSWREDPVRELQKRIARTAAEGARRLVEKPLPVSNNLAASLERWIRSLGCALLIILDQFEEYFLYHSPKEQKSFANELASAVTAARLPCNFIISIRDDALARLDILDKNIPSVFQAKYAIRHLNREQATSAIIGPVDRYNERNGTAIALDSRLVANVLTEIQTGKLVLGVAGQGRHRAPRAEDSGFEAPFLQLVMTKLWDKSAATGRINLTTLNKLGGVASIVEKHVDDKMAELPSAQQEIVTRIFYQLVTPSGRKIAHGLHDLADSAKAPKKTVEALLNDLCSAPARILVPAAVSSPDKSEAYYEISHDILAPAILKWCSRREVAEATRQLEEQERERRAAFARELASAAISNLGTDPERSLLLALYATSLSSKDAAGEAPGSSKAKSVPEAENALFEALRASHVRKTLTG